MVYIGYTPLVEFISPVILYTLYEPALRPLVLGFFTDIYNGIESISDSDTALATNTGLKASGFIKL